MDNVTEQRECCGCRRCLEEWIGSERAKGRAFGLVDNPLNRMILCAICGNKRCPHASDHRHACTGSNEPGQDGSDYPAMTDAELMEMEADVVSLALKRMAKTNDAAAWTPRDLLVEALRAIDEGRFRPTQLCMIAYIDEDADGNAVGVPGGVNYRITTRLAGPYNGTHAVGMIERAKGKLL